MKRAILILGILILFKVVNGNTIPENLRFCVFAGDFEIATLAGEIKKKSERMIYSVVVDFEELSNILDAVKSKAVIITSRKIVLDDGPVAKRANFLWVTTSDFKNSSSTESNSSQTLAVSLHKKNNPCGSSLAIGVISEEGICDNMASKGGFGKIECYHYYLMDMLGRRLNFTTKIAELQDKQYPYIYPNGTHSGLFNILSDQNVDVSCGSFVVTGKRLEEYIFLWPTFTLEIKIFIKREGSDYSWTNYLKPFEMHVWAAITAYLALSAIIKYLLYNYFDDSMENKISLSKAFLLSLQICCNQAPQDVSSDRLSVRLAHFCGLFGVMILYPVYSGKVVSSLTVSQPHLPFHDFEGLIADRRFTILTSEGDFMTYYLYFEIGNDLVGERKNLLAGLENLSKNIKEGMKSVCDSETLAYTDPKENLAVVINELECNVVDIPKSILVLYLGMIVNKNLPCTDRLNSELIYLHSAGITKRMNLEMVPPLAFRKLQAVKSEIQSIVIAEIYPCLVFYALSLLVVLIILSLELNFSERYSQGQKRKSRNLFEVRRRRFRNRCLAEIRCETPNNGSHTLMM